MGRAQAEQARKAATVTHQAIERSEDGRPLAAIETLDDGSTRVRNLKYDATARLRSIESAER